MPASAISFDGRQPGAVTSALAILGIVAASRPGVTAREIHQGLAIPRATVYRILKFLVDEGYLVRTPELTGFTLGSRVLEFTRDAHQHLAV